MAYQGLVGNSDEPQTYSPVLTFGGASTGITYVIQYGIYSVTIYPSGLMRVDINLFVALSNKGSSAGAASVSLPILTGANASNYLIPMTGSAISSVAGGLFFVQPDNVALTGRLDYTTGNSGIFNRLFNTNFVNNSAFGFQGFYFVN